ncbi:MAG: PEP-CTERM sorting domain-containing protein [Anaerolineae bacterium]|nr:PEP-CTERM sorting domain-containing protein [Phycisphaerae bacterium]
MLKFIPVGAKKSSRSLAVAVGAVALGSTLAPVLAAPNYNIISLGVVVQGDTTSTGMGVSPNGQYVTGFSSVTGANHALLWQSGTGSTALPGVAGKNFNMPQGVNNAGAAAGTAATTFFGSAPLPVLWKNNTATAYPLPGGETLGRANSINSAETAVGSVDGGSLEQAAVFAMGGSQVMTQTMPNGGVLKTAFGINDAGRIVGQALDPTNAAVTKGFYIDPGDATATDIGALTALGHNSAIPFGVSTNGFVTGSSSLNSGVGSRAFLWSEADGMLEVPLPAGTSQGQGRGVNASGWIVGSASSATSIPFLYDGITSVSLQSLLSGAAGWDLTSGTSNAAFSISDNGIITGRGLLNGVVTGFVMVPVPEPTSIGLLAVGAGAIAIRRRRNA